MKQKGEVAMFYAQGSIIVHRPVEEVFTLLPYAVTDNMQNASHLINMAYERVPVYRAMSTEKVEVGTIFQRQVQGQSVQSIATYKVVELEPNRKLILEQQIVGAFASSAMMSYTLEPVPEGTRLRVTGEADGLGCVRVMYKVFDTIPGMKRFSVSFMLRQLKRTLEQGIFLQPAYRISGPLPELDESQLPAEGPE